MTQWQKILLYAIVPAVIAGLFSVAPKIYDIVVEPNAELTYRITDGPELSINDGFRKIVALSVTNSGKKPLTDVKAVLALSSGKLEKVAVSEASGLAPAVQETSHTASVSIATFFPGETITISAMVLTAQSNIKPNFLLRSKETLGKLTEEETTKRTTKLDFLGALFAGFSVFFMSTFMLLKVKRGFPFGDDKQDILFYIAARFKLHSITEDMKLASTELTYRRMADILLAHGLIANGEDRENTVSALKCLLLIDRMASFSREVVIDNLKVLEGEDFSDEEIDLISRKAANGSKLRQQVNSFATNRMEFLNAV